MPNKRYRILGVGIIAISGIAVIEVDGPHMHAVAYGPLNHAAERIHYARTSVTSACDYRGA